MTLMKALLISCRDFFEWISLVGYIVQRNANWRVFAFFKKFLKIAGIAALGVGVAATGGALLPALAPALGGATLGGTLGSVASIVGGLAPIASTVLGARQQSGAAKDQLAKIQASQAASQASFRDGLRSGSSGRGTGDFGQRTGSGSFDTALKKLTGRG